MATFLITLGATLSVLSVPHAAVALAILACLAFLAGVSTGILPAAKQAGLYAAGGLLTGLLLGVSAGVATAGLPNAGSVLLHLLVAAAALLALAAAAWRIFRQKEALEMQSEWDTVGRGLRGWSVTPAAALLLLGAALAALAIGVPIGDRGDAKLPPPVQTETTKK